MTSYYADRCYVCGATTRGIYVRRNYDGRWQTLAICDAHWHEQEGDKRAVRLLADESDNVHDP